MWWIKKRVKWRRDRGVCAQKVGLRRVGFSASGEIGRDEDGMKAGLSQTIKKKKIFKYLVLE